MVRKGYTPEQIITKLREGEALLIASARCHPARANDSNSNLTSGIITGGRSPDLLDCLLRRPECLYL